MTRALASSLQWQDPHKTLIGLNCLQPFGYGITLNGAYVASPYENGGSDAQVMPDARLTAIKAAGFDFVRMAVDPGTLMAAGTDTALDGLIAQVMTGVARRTSRGLKVIVDLHFAGGNPAVSAWGYVAVLDGVNGAKFTRFKHCAARLGAAIHAAAGTTCTPSDVCLEVFNEPPGPWDISTASWSIHLHDLFLAVRAALPLHTIVVGGNCFNALDATAGGQTSGLTALSPAGFDENTGFAFHPYESALFTFQGWAGTQYQYMHGLTFPATLHPGGQAAAASAFTAVAGSEGDHDGVAAADALNACVTQAAWSTSVAQYFSRYGNKASLAARLATVTSWAIAAGLTKKRLFNTEVGVNFAGADDATEESAAAFIAAVREISQEACINCLTIHEMQGSDFGIQDTSAPWTFKAAIIAALFGGSMPKTVKSANVEFDNVGGGTYTVKTQLIDASSAVVATATSDPVVVPADPAPVPVAIKPVITVS